MNTERQLTERWLRIEAGEEVDTETERFFVVMKNAAGQFTKQAVKASSLPHALFIAYPELAQSVIESEVGEGFDAEKYEEGEELQQAFLDHFSEDDLSDWLADSGEYVEDEDSAGGSVPGMLFGISPRKEGALAMLASIEVESSDWEGEEE